MTSKEFKFNHRPVLFDESMEYLDVKSNGTYIDCTTGGGGHSSGILSRLGEGGLLLCFDKDEQALEAAKITLDKLTTKASYRFIKSDFAQIGQYLKNEGIQNVDGMIADFGVSSYQLDENNRGFGYMQDGPLDMRMDKSAALTAETVVNKYSSEELEKILFEFGEERYSKRIVSAIIKEREKQRITSTKQLADIIRNAMPSQSRKENQHPAKRTFQAIRIEVNHELDSISGLLESIPEILSSKGRFVAISFHSLEDRLVKDIFKKFEDPCICPKNLPVCGCNRKPVSRILTKKPVVAGEEELESNPRARSAKLRAIEMI
ncbi:MAG: 16S rRNA (cytosine(1402)-N(4))-methyltransferase RsmH [Saccharofermentanales bacterium]